MPLRAVSTGTIAFGLVNIPVKLYSAANPSAGISFRLLSKEGNRLSQQYVDPKKDNAVVPRSEMVKGYEFAKDQYVLFKPDELKELEEKSTQSIDIVEFVPERKVPKLYHDKTYFLGPDKGGDRAYRLLAEAMKETGRCGLAKYAARGKMYLVLVAPFENGLVMHQLHYADEVQPFSEVPIGEGDVKGPELQLAMQLISQASNEEFKPEQYEDEVKKRVEAVIQQKIEGKAVTIASEEPPKAQIIDLMAALKASLEASGAAPTPPAASEPEAAAEAEAEAPSKKKKKSAKGS